VQSFDWRTLRALRQRDAGIATACLTIESERFNTLRADATGASPWHDGLKLADHGGSLAQLVRAAGCTIWSPFWRNLDADLVRSARKIGLRVIPWTVNEPADIERVLDLDIDGLITDYPDRAREILRRRGIAVD
jgi:glycerophosphoryl diester phosphodiesterase